MTSSGLTPIYLYLQKLLLFDSAEEDSSVLRQHCSELTEGKARVLKMQPNMIDIVPLSASKGGGIRILLDHLGITEDVSIYSHRRTIFSVHLLYLISIFVVSSVKKVPSANVTVFLRIFFCSVILMLLETMQDG